MYGSLRQIASVVVYDPGADKSVPVLRAPGDHNITIEAAYVCPDTTVAASTVSYYNIHLMNGGVAGTDTTSISGTVGNTSVAWTANTPKTATIVAGSGKLTAGQWLVAKYNEEGTVAPGSITIVVEYVEGVGDKAAA